MTWMNTYDGVFFISLATIITGAIGLSFKYCLKSKCEHFNCCYGLFKIDRRVDLELEGEIKELELNANKDGVEEQKEQV